MFVLFLECMYYSGSTSQERLLVKLTVVTPEQKSCTIMKYFLLETSSNVLICFDFLSLLFNSKTNNK